MWMFSPLFKIFLVNRQRRRISNARWTTRRGWLGFWDHASIIPSHRSNSSSIITTSKLNTRTSTTIWNRAERRMYLTITSWRYCPFAISTVDACWYSSSAKSGSITNAVWTRSSRDACYIWRLPYWNQAHRSPVGSSSSTWTVSPFSKLGSSPRRLPKK